MVATCELGAWCEPRAPCQAAKAPAARRRARIAALAHDRRRSRGDRAQCNPVPADRARPDEPWRSARRHRVGSERTLPGLRAPGAFPASEPVARTRGGHVGRFLTPHAAGLELLTAAPSPLWFLDRSAGEVTLVLMLSLI